MYGHLYILMFSKINRIGLLNKGLFIEELTRDSVIETTYIPYNKLKMVSYKDSDKSVILRYGDVDDDWSRTCEIPKECMVSTRVNNNNLFCERKPDERILNLYNQLTMEYMTKYYDDKD